MSQELILPVDRGVPFDKKRFFCEGWHVEDCPGAFLGQSLNVWRMSFYNYRPRGGFLDLDSHAFTTLWDNRTKLIEWQNQLFGGYFFQFFFKGVTLWDENEISHTLYMRFGPDGFSTSPTYGQKIWHWGIIPTDYNWGRPHPRLMHLNVPL